MKVLVISDLSEFAVCQSFIRALRAEGHSVHTMDVGAQVAKHVRFGSLGLKAHHYLGVEPWLRKANRDLAVLGLSLKPDLVLVFGNAPVQFGTLALWSSVLPAKKLLFWPDTLANLEQAQLNAAPLYDAVASYSSAAIPVFRKLGFKDALWTPFAGDIEWLGPPKRVEGFDYDFTFVGGWRPERERAVALVLHRFPNLRVHVRGYGWDRCTNERIRGLLGKGNATGRAFGDILRASAVNLNVIDDTNYPAANMRFFEILAVGGLQLSSACPEQEGEFINGEHLLYFRDDDELAEGVRLGLESPELATRIRQAGHAKLMSAHQYSHRITSLMDYCRDSR